MAARRKRTERRSDLSQHFLRSPALAASLISQAPVRPDDLVIEIGPGRGVLTTQLAKRCRRVVGVELDGYLCRRLRERFRAEQRVSIVHADFLRYALPERDGYKVVGNIPFNRTAAIVDRLASAAPPPEDAFLVLQQEAAERFAGTPFAPESMASLQLKPWWQVEIVRRLRRADFQPPPNVDSVVLWMARRARPLVDDAEAREYHSLVETCFGRTGNTIGRCLRSLFTRTQIRRLGRDLRFDLSQPPSGLAFGQWLGLFRFLKIKKGQ